MSTYSDSTIGQSRLQLLLEWVTSSRFAAPTALVLVITFVYYKSLVGSFLTHDDVRLLAFVVDNTPWHTFLDHSELWFGAWYYRPVFVVQMWALNRLFGLNYAAYQAVTLLFHIAASIALYAAIMQLWGRRSLALVIAFLFALRPETNELTMVWVSDAAPVTNFVATLVLLLLIQPGRLRWFTLFFPLLLLAPFTRENGAILVAAAFAFAVFCHRQGLMARCHAIAIAASSVVVTSIYTAFRLQALDATRTPAEIAMLPKLWQQLPMVQGIPPWSVERLPVTFQTVTINTIAIFLPVVEYNGTISWVLVLQVVGAALFVVGVCLRRRATSRTSALPALALVSVGSGTVIGTLLLLPHVAAVTLYAALSAYIVMTLARKRAQLRDRERRLVLLGLTLIVLNSIVAITYFRWRNLSLGYLGWLLLLSVALIQQAPLRRDRRRTRLVIFLLAGTVVLSGSQVYSGLPRAHLDPSVSQNASILCEIYVPEALALQLAREYDLDLGKVRECHAVKPQTLAYKQEGEQPLARPVAFRVKVVAGFTIDSKLTVKLDIQTPR